MKLNLYRVQGEESILYIEAPNMECVIDIWKEQAPHDPLTSITRVLSEPVIRFEPREEEPRRDEP